MSAGFLTDEKAAAAIVLWGSGMFDTKQIADVMHVREDAVYRTLQMAKDGAKKDREAQR